MCIILLATHDKDCKVYKHVRIAPHQISTDAIGLSLKTDKKAKERLRGRQVQKKMVPPNLRKNLALTFPLYPCLPFPQNQQPQKIRHIPHQRHQKRDVQYRKRNRVD